MKTFLKAFAIFALFVTIILTASCTSTQTGGSVVNDTVYEQETELVVPTFRELPPICPVLTKGCRWIAGNYCQSSDERLMKVFTLMLKRYGDQGFMAVMNDPKLPCVYSRFHAEAGVRPVVTELLEHKWDFTSLDGEKLALWTFKDMIGQIGFTWLPIKGEST